ncbi:MAG: T9SS type A sorting domain-containing protein [Bacteroidia bacterium]
MKNRNNKQSIFSFLMVCFLISNAIGQVNDNVCGALPLIYGVNGPFSTTSATVQAGEPAPPGGLCQSQMSWCDNIISNTLWFSFVAPPSGRVQIQSPAFDTQLALWDAANCDTILHGGATLIAANDDDPDALTDEGVIYSSFLNPVSCLVPGKTYYVQLDPYSSPGGSTEVILNDLGFADPSFTGLHASYCITDSASNLIPAQPGGTFTGAGMSGNLFIPAVAGIGTYSIVYKLSNCDSMIHTTVVSGVPNASYTYSNVSNVYSFTNTSTSALTYTWDFGDLSPTSSLANPSHTFTANGAYNVQLIITNDCGTDTVMHQIVITGVAGIEELSIGSVFVYPNPTNGNLNITIENAHFKELKINIFDLQGKEVYNETDKNSSQYFNKQINIGNLSKGIYSLKISTEKGIKIQKLIIQ